MAAKKVWKDADDIAEGVTGRKPTTPRPPKLVVDAIDDLPVMSKTEKNQAAKAARAAQLEEARVKRQLDREEQKKRADQLKAMGEVNRGVSPATSGKNAPTYSSGKQTGYCTEVLPVVVKASFSLTTATSCQRSTQATEPF